MEYGQIFHVMRIGKYYCKNMKYRIKSTYLSSDEASQINRVVCIESEVTKKIS